MTLVDLTRGLFTYLVRFRQQAAQPDPPSLGRVRQELLARFEEMAEQVRRQPHLRVPYQMVAPALAALADEVACRSDWPHVREWEGDPLALHLFGRPEAEAGFFARLEGLRNPPPDVLGIYYLCLALGLRGDYPPDHPELARVKSDLLSRLPSRPSLESPPPLAQPPAPAAARGIPPLVAREAAPGERSTRPILALRAREGNRGGQRTRVWALAALVLALGLGGWWGLRPDPLPRPPAPVKASPPLPPPAAKAAPEPVPASPPPVTKSAPEPVPASPPPVTKSAPEPVPASPPPVTKSAPEPVPASPAPVAKAAPEPAPVVEGGHQVQAGLFVGPIQAGRLAEGIRGQGYPAAIVQREIGGKTRYLVLAGPFAQRQEALEAVESLRRKMGIQPYLTDPQDLGRRLP